MANVTANHAGYTNEVVETAPQGALVIMLLNGAIQRAREAKRQLAEGARAEVHNDLVRAQEMIAELRGALNMPMGEIPNNLDRIYAYCQRLLVKANIHKQAASIDECIRLMTAMRNTWQEIYKETGDENAAMAPQRDGRAAVVFNFEG